MKKIPGSLKKWFIAHFIIDMIFGIPLLLFPGKILGLFGFSGVETFTARLVGAALIGIGGVSFFARHEKPASYKSLLLLKILWSGAAIVAIILSIIEGAPWGAWLILIIFVIFAFIWNYYRVKLA